MKVFALILTLAIVQAVASVGAETPNPEAPILETPSYEGGSAVWALTFEGLTTTNGRALVAVESCYDERSGDCWAGEHEMYTEPYFLTGYLDAYGCMPPPNHSGPIFECYGEFGMTVGQVLELEAGTAVAMARMGDTNMRLSPSGNEIDLLNCTLDKVAARIPLSALAQ